MFTLKIYSSKGLSVHSILGNGITVINHTHQNYEQTHKHKFGEEPNPEKHYCFVSCWIEGESQMSTFAINQFEEGYLVNQNGKTVEKIIAN